MTLSASGSAVVVEGLIIGADLGVDLVHVVNHNLGNRVVIGVASLASLEEDIVVLGGTADHRMLWIQSAAAELVHSLPIQHIGQILIIPLLDLLYFVRGTEAVEEMQERHSALDGAQVGYRAQVHDLLGAVGAQHGVAGLAAGINIGMVTENRKGMAGNRTGGYMNNAGQQFAGHLIHVGDHQQQSLRSSVGSGQRAALQRAVHRAGGAGLGLHLGYLYFSAEQVFHTVGGKLVRLIRHYGRGGDGVDGGYVGKRIRYIRGGVVTYPWFSFFLPCNISSFKVSS